MKSTEEIWKKHFGDNASVGIGHENIEAFFDELAQACIEEDKANCRQIGQKVIYTRTGEPGIVKSLSDKPRFVFVVYSCGGDWANFQNYTASLTKCADLVDGWQELPTNPKVST